MTATTETDNYIYRISRLLHWLCAICFVQLVVSMPIMLDEANNSSERREVYMMHQSTAAIFMLLLALRFAWMYKKKTTATKIVFEYHWQHNVAKANHLILYFIMVLMPLTGLVDRISNGKAIDMFGVEMIPSIDALINKDLHFFAGEAHLWLVNLFYVLIAFHVIGAITHVLPRYFKANKAV